MRAMVNGACLCGALFCHCREGIPFVLIPGGIFDGDPGSRPDAHIHVTSGASWYKFRDDIPQFAELPSA